MKKKIALIISGIIFFIVLITILFLYINFKNSYKYTQYQLYKAEKQSNSEIALKYYDFDKIVDNKISETITNELDGNPFAALGIAMIENVRPSLIKTIQKNVEDSFDNSDKDNLPNMPVLFWCAYNDKPISNRYTVKFQKINDKKVLRKECNLKGDNCTIYTMQKIDKNWIITGIDF